MLLRILKKDLKRKKTMNLILFLFLTLATMFLAGSVRNMRSIIKSIEYFGTVTRVSDFFNITKNPEQETAFLDQKSYVEDYSVSEMLVVDDDLFYDNDQKVADSGSMMLCTIGPGYNQILNEKNQIIESVQDGEIILCYQLAQKQGIKIGDKISLSTNGISAEFTVAEFCKDMVFGSPYSACKRLVISQKDHQRLSETVQDHKVYLVSVMTEDTKQLKQDLATEKIDSMFSMDYAMLCTVFTMDLMVMAIMIIMSMILIAIAVVVLRFSILFTIQEEYKEIGVMKAVGLPQKSIKKVYLMKYIVISLVGATAGVLASFPFSQLLISSLGKNIALESGLSGWWIHVVCGVLVVLFVLLYCNLCTSRVKKISAMQAIRSGESGERFTRKSPAALHRNKRLAVRSYLAVNDILSSPRRYLSMVITFALGIVMIILIDNAANTLSDPSIMRQMGFQSCDVAVDNGKMTVKAGCSADLLQEEVEELEALYRSKGVAVHLFQEYMVQTVISSEKQPVGESVNAYCIVNTDRSQYSYTKGMAPVLPNECALTESTMEDMKVKIGDTIQLNASGKTDNYIVTAAYQCMLDGGYGIRLAPSAPSGTENVSRVLQIQGTFEEDTDVEAEVQKMKEITPDYKVSGAKGFVESQLGTVIITLTSVKYFLLAIAVIINIAIAVLMVKTFLAKERSELALMMSMGISTRSLRRYHTERMLIVVIVGMILGSLASLLFDRPMVWMTFGMMGANDIRLVRAPYRVYLLYPVFLAAITSVAAYISTRAMKKIEFHEINHME